MPPTFQPLLCALLCLWAAGARADITAWLPQIRELEAERAALERKLATLPEAPPVQATQRLGWHSEYSGSDAKAEWVELNLGQAQAVDAVVLIAPPPGPSSSAGYGFPRRFFVELLGEGEDPQRTIIADHAEADFPNPGSLPVVIQAGGRLAQKVRITATRLYGAGGRYFIALGEVMLLQGKENLGARVESAGPAAVLASSSQGTRPDWGRINLVDGHTALGPPLGTRPSPAPGFRSRPVSESHLKEPPWVEIDLGRVVPVDEVRLFPAHPPQFAHTQGYGFPVRYQVELREEEDEEPQVLRAPQSGSYHALPGDNVVTLPAGGRRARHVRLTALEPHVSNGSAVLALAEMQVWSGGRNIAPGSHVRAPHATETDGWSTAALVDGFASGADILDWPAWLAGLSERRAVGHQLSLITARRGSIAKAWQRAGLGVAGALVMAGMMAGFAWLHRQRRSRQLELERLRQRISQDLHDEIGSSLGSIALIAQDLMAVEAPPAQLRDDLTQIKETADETVAAMRDIARLMQSGRYGTDDLPVLLRDTAARMLRGLQHEVSITGQAQTRLLAVDRQRDLVLMFKEALHNITRHARATQVWIALRQEAGNLVLTVRDNGRGFDTSAASGGMGLANLRRRAARHQGCADITSCPQGTLLTLKLPLHA